MSEDSQSAGGPDPVHVEHHPPEEMFGILGNETRLAIVRALGEAEAEAVSFSDLRERVGMADSGQFNYHLDKLTDRFVRKTDAGYELSLAGQQLVGALLAGTYTATAETTDPLAVDAPCPECGAREIVAEYADELVKMRCLACEDWYNQVSFPPGVLDQFAPEELPEAFDRWLLAAIERVHTGFCHNCAGRVEGHLEVSEDHRQGVEAVYPCERCGDEARVAVVVPLLLHPVGMGALYEHGLDLRRTPLWEVAARVDETVTISGREPPTVALEVTVDDETISASLAADLTIEDVERAGG